MVCWRVLFMIAGCVGADLWGDIKKMTTARLTERFSDVDDQMKELWKWYGLELMVQTARKDWPWKSKQNRLCRRFSDCVTVGDEALALQIISLRGKMYVKQRDQKEQGVEVKVGRGRKKAESGEDTAYKALTARFDVYRAMRGLVSQIRVRELGWDAHLMAQVALGGVTMANEFAGASGFLINQDEDQMIDIDLE